MLFLLLLGNSFISLQAIRRQARSFPPIQWMISYSLMLEIGLLAFAISGAFLELANFDLFYQLVASVAILKILQREALLASQAQAEAGSQLTSGGLIGA